MAESLTDKSQDSNSVVDLFGERPAEARRKRKPRPRPRRDLPPPLDQQQGVLFAEPPLKVIAGSKPKPDRLGRNRNAASNKGRSRRELEERPAPLGRGRGSAKTRVRNAIIAGATLGISGNSRADNTRRGLAQRVLLMITDYADHEDGANAYPGDETIAKLLGHSRGRVSTARGWLANAGMIRATGEGRLKDGRLGRLTWAADVRAIEATIPGLAINSDPTERERKPDEASDRKRQAKAKGALKRGATGLTEGMATPSAGRRKGDGTADIESERADQLARLRELQGEDD